MYANRSGAVATDSTTAEARQETTAVLTGATGFLGGELLRYLLVESDRRFVCAIRAESAEHAHRRGEARLRELFGPDAALHSHRVDWVRSDLEEARLGWNQATWSRVARQIDEIFHCAAAIDFDLPLDQAHRINVDGTRHMHELARAASAARGSFRRFHHVSTAYVAGRRSGPQRPHDLPPDRATCYRNTYERTKARAERFLRAEADASVPVSIHRPSIVGGDSLTGETTSWNVVYVPMKLIASGAFPVFTVSGPAHLDTVAVDYVVRGMAAFAEIDTRPLEAHHLTAGPNGFCARTLIHTTYRTAVSHGRNASPTRLVGPMAWRALTTAVNAAARLPRTYRVARQASLARRGIQRCGMYVPYGAVRTTFDDAAAREVLEPLGIAMPDGEVYLDRILDYALRTNFGRRALDPPDGTTTTVAQATATRATATRATATRATATRAMATRAMATRAMATRAMATRAMATRATATRAMATRAMATRAMATRAMATQTMATQTMATQTMATQTMATRTTAPSASVEPPDSGLLGALQ